MDCSNCGATNLLGSFCNACGSELNIEPEITCNACGADDQRGHYCHMCGVKHNSVNVCPHCNAKNQTGNFCKSCGGVLIIDESDESRPDRSGDGVMDDYISETVRCRACGGRSNRYRSPGVKVEYCTLCGVGSSHLAFM